VAQSGYGMSYGAGYASSPCWPAAGGIAPGGGYYSQPYGAGYGGVNPAGGFPAPMPGTGGTSQPDTAVPANAEKVRMSDNAYEPATLNITTGTTVRWTNEGKNPHTVTSDKGTWGSGDIPPGGEFTATFTKAGTFDYHCKHHPNMKGTIVVK
jgi:plastocyanin